jgi:transposase-like protein
MPKKIDPALRERALRMVAEHQQDYSSVTAVSKVVGDKLGLGKETVRRWVVQSEINSGARDGMTSEEHAEVKRLKGEVKKLREDNEILKAASIFFAGELDPRNR